MELANDKNRLGGVGLSSGPIQSIYRDYNNVASLQCEKRQGDREPDYASASNDSVAPIRAKGWARIKMMFLHPGKDPNLELVRSEMEKRGLSAAITNISDRFGK
jgi:hypothetical protein